MKYLCIHGHFYQPPRENPWLETIELQDTAYPYHDWNERISAECYAPNAAARILDGNGRIVRIVNNYSRISFNFGPTVLSWAKDKAPGLHQAIVDADEESCLLFSGHGSALAQCYNHMIMPLANRRDKITQIRWGIADFCSRFSREPEGMWLPETAVDLETLDLLAEHGIRFTILAPSQANRFRKFGDKEWIDVSGARIDPRRPYRVITPSGKPIAVFFYDGPISRAVAFEQLLNNGEVFAARLLGAFSDDSGGSQLAHIATDGESYGHHHRYGEMALVYALQLVENREDTELTNYGQFLEKFPPEYEAEIFENTAWSCVHGLGRWMRDCSCNSGGNSGWNQAWREPLRAALDWLRDCVAPLFEREGGELFTDAWKARDEYIHVVLDRSPAEREAFFAANAIRELTAAEQVRAFKLMEMQRHAMLMYTSCGWFFDEISGIETVQVIQYAGRVVQLAEELFGQKLEADFLQRLAAAKSNIPDHRDGAHIYEKFVKPAMVDLLKVGAHYAISSLFRDYPEEARIYSYTARRDDHHTHDAGRLRLAVGRVHMISEITQESGELSFGVLHFGDHNLYGAVRASRDEDKYEELRKSLVEAFGRADIPDVIRLLDQNFGPNTFSLRDLFRDEQRSILDEILTSTLDEAEAAYRALYEHHAPLMRFLADLRAPLPKAFRTTAEYALNSHLRLEMASDDLDVGRIRNLLEEGRMSKVDLDATTLEYTLRRTIERKAAQLQDDPDNPDRLRKLGEAVALTGILPFPVTLWTVQNICYNLLQTRYGQVRSQAEEGDEDGAAWCESFRKLAQDLSLRIG